MTNELIIILDKLNNYLLQIINNKISLEKVMCYRINKEIEKIINGLSNTFISSFLKCFFLTSNSKLTF